MATGVKLRMRGYRSMGLSVPLVMTTLWNFWNTGRIANPASRQLNCVQLPPPHLISLFSLVNNTIIITIIDIITIIIITIINAIIIKLF